MNEDTARIVLKSINRPVRRRQIFRGGKTFGVDYNTWNACYPHLAKSFTEAARLVTGRRGRYIPSALFD